jgi:hypothetical protein
LNRTETSKIKGVSVMSVIHPDDFAAAQMLINDIQALESRAHRLKMLRAAHALNAAKNAAGWELAEQAEAALTKG